MKLINYQKGAIPENTLPGTSARPTRRSFFVRACVVLLAAGLGLMPVFTQAGAVPGIGGKKALDVYFSNVYIGALIDRVLLVDPNDLEKLLEATTLCYWEMVQSTPAKRMDAVAAEIIARNPDVVGLAELYTLQVAEMNAPAARTDIFDYLGLLVQALAARGGHYEIAVVATESDVTMPVFLENRVKLARIVDHEAILVRTDLPPGQLRYTNPMSGNFENRIVIPSAGIDLLRGWCSIDMTVRGERFRLICAHLETEDVPQLQYAQALELLAGPADTALPVVLIGDFNTDPLARDGSYTYPLFGEAGFADSWNMLNPEDPAGGLSWGHDPWLADPDTLFDRRIDLILYRGAQITPSRLEVINPLIGTVPPLWFSDHAAVSATLQLGNPKSVKQLSAVGAGK